MISDERLDEIIENNPTFDERVTLAYEIKRLRAELARYRTPQVENATFHMQGQIFNPRTMRWDVIFSHQTPNVDNIEVKS